MMYTNNTFATLISQFPTTEALFTWLRSPEGGRLIIRQTKDSPLALICYDKVVSNLLLPHVGAFRSVIWDERTNRPVCVAPVKSTPLTDNLQFTSVEELVDGTMLNQFWDGERWRLATRTLLDASGAYYGAYRDGDATRSFADLFNETLPKTVMDVLPKTMCYSWVLNHPAERVVVPAKYGLPTLTLVEVAEIDAANGGVNTWAGPSLQTLPELPSSVQRLLPQQHTDLKTTEDCKARTTAWGERFRHEWQGLVMRDAQGTRYRVRSVEYDAARVLRGSQSNLRYLWLERWSEGRLPAYLAIYPEEAIPAEETIASFKAATEELYELYQRVYRRREMPLGTAPRKYRKLLWDVHAVNSGAYFPALRAFMNAQDTARKLWLVNYERRFESAAADNA